MINIFTKTVKRQIKILEYLSYNANLADKKFLLDKLKINDQKLKIDINCINLWKHMYMNETYLILMK
ncbi:hypothetical protein ABGF48_02520 [Helcococcus bovis]|uniref:hypothetical protein n=1 Tax=Helcococcus bovis TaxID=3153252 RepID=UPI0038B86E5F